MSIPTRLEAYLNVLNKSLGPIPLSDRSDIITEIKSHVLEAMERDPSLSLEKLLQSLGEPESVANKYLLERGLKPSKPPRRPMMQWLVVGAVSTIAMILLFVTFVIWRFTPIIDVNEKEGRVQLLGGLISVDEDSSFNFGNGDINFSSDARKISGSYTLKTPAKAEIQIPFTNGKIDLQTSDDNTLSWKCTAYDGASPAAVTEKGGRYVLDFSQARGMKCDISIPANTTVSLNGANGKVDIEKPRYN
ncbi:MAG: DUF1700 domain-containing protein, partial [Bdellovibrionia bacterium]